MPLSAGTKLGPYEILAPIGAGGMGEVYRARDSRLNRDVAIKTLPAAFANDAERMARFQREAQVLAALNHPNIAAIYGIEESAIVMELVEGKNLAGPVPVDEAITIARQIADALDAAHQKNIIHRDLKPANVKITPGGSVKVLDFGLAKAFEPNPVTGDPANSPTVTMEATRAGMILGTAAYMSPEQARGKAVDKRADIWSFGVVFYELLTGERAFEGETVSDTLAAVLRADIDWKRLPAATPISVRPLLERCLQRDPNKRLRDIGDAWAYFDNDFGVNNVPAAAPPRGTKLNWILGAIAALAIIASGAVTWTWLHVPAAQPRPVTRSATPLEHILWNPALSRDGTRLAYGYGNQLALRMMDQREGKEIPGAGSGTSPAFSPDGQWLAFVSRESGTKLRKIPVSGGTPFTICDIADSTSTSRMYWGWDDTIIFGSHKGLMRVPATGGTPQPLTSVNSNNGELSHDSPEFLPDGRTILFTINGTSEESSRIALLDLNAGTARTLVNGGHAARFVPSGHLVYMRGTTLFAVPFDLKRLVATGPEAPVAEGIYRDFYAFSDSSLLVLESSGGSTAPSTLEWTDRKGVAEPFPESPRRWQGITVSPDGKLLAGSIADDSGRERADIWKFDLERRTLTRLTIDGFNLSPVWTPDGRWVTFCSMRDGNKSGIYRVAVDESSPPELLVPTGGLPLAWTPDGRTLLYEEARGEKFRLWVLRVPGDGSEGKSRLFSQSPFNESLGALSPDGKWLAYESNESGNYEIYVAPFPGPGGKFQISPNGGVRPAWSHTGRELYYQNPDRHELMAVGVSTGSLFRAGTPEALFKLPGKQDFFSSLSVTPDPKRFLVQRKVENASPATLVTVTDWFDELRRKAPVKQ